METCHCVSTCLENPSLMRHVAESEWRKGCD